MNPDHLLPLADRFFSSLDSDEFLIEQGAVLARRGVKIRELLQPERISTLTVEEIRALFADTDTMFGIRYPPDRFFDSVLGKQNERAESMRAWLAELVRTAEAGLNPDELNRVRGVISGVGPSFVSELLMHRFPDRYWIWNSPIKAFIVQAFGESAVRDLQPKGRKSNRGEEYFAAGRILQSIRELLTERSGKSVDFIAVDLFMYWGKKHLQPVAEVIGESGSVYSGVVENSDSDMEKKLARLIPDDDLRYQWLQVVADAVELAAELSDVNWSLTFPQNGKYLRLNVAGVEVMYISSDSVLLVVKDSILTDDDILAVREQGGNVFKDPKSDKSVPGSKSRVELQHSNVDLYTRFLRDAHGGYIRMASATQRGKNTWRGAHNMLLLSYLNDLFDLDLPQPLYLNELHSDDSALNKTGPQSAASSIAGNGNMPHLNINEILRSAPISNAKRQEYRRQKEDEARELLRRKLGALSGDDMTQLFRLISSDLDDAEHERVDRFMPALYGQLVLQMREDVDAFNRWTERIWNAGEEELSAVLNSFWKRGEVKGAGISMPTVLLYLKDPEHYAIWLPVMQTALEFVYNFKPGRFRVADSYLHYNEAVQRFRREHSVTPQAADLALWKIALKVRDVVVSTEPDPVPEPHLPMPPYPLERLAADTGIPSERLVHWIKAIERKDQAIIYGPPGTGKTYVARHLARHIVGGGTGFIETVQFHPAYAYEDFMQGIRPVAMENGTFSYTMVPGVFMNFCRQAEECGDDLCVLILDEINRANLSRVFGELMYLMEYRDQSVRLAGNGQEFRIPANVRIIGTMNTADRSIALVDHALRRRFAFIELRPEYGVLRNWHRTNDTGFNADGLCALLKRLNGAINDPHYEVGISFFLLRDIADQIEQIWRMEIEPYLQEYFLGRPDWKKQFGWENVREKITG